MHHVKSAILWLTCCIFARFLSSCQEEPTFRTSFAAAFGPLKGQCVGFRDTDLVARRLIQHLAEVHVLEILILT